MKLFFEKMGWHILPVVIILVGSYSLFCIFRSILEKFEEPKLKRVVFALCFAFLALFVSVGISSTVRTLRCLYALKSAK